MKRFLILVLLSMGCSRPPVHEAANTTPVHPLPPPNPAVEKREVAQPIQSVPLAVVDVPLPPADESAEREKLSRLRPLRSTVVPGGDLEVRVWSGFGIMLLEGFVLRQSGGRWSAVDLGWSSTRDRKGKNRVATKDRKLAEPDAGWEPAWRRPTDAGLLTVPRREKTDCPDVATVDGISYVIEFKTNGRYRNYMYDNPEGVCDAERQVLQIIAIVAEEFYSN
jgi:hypothetical protein